MTPKLTQIFVLFRPCCKTDAMCGWLPAARAARTMVEQLIWLFYRPRRRLLRGYGANCARRSRNGLALSLHNYKN